MNNRRRSTGSVCKLVCLGNYSSDFSFKYVPRERKLGDQSTLVKTRFESEFDTLGRECKNIESDGVAMMTLDSLYPTSHRKDEYHPYRLVYNPNETEHVKF